MSRQESFNGVAANIIFVASERSDSLDMLIKDAVRTKMENPLKEVFMVSDNHHILVSQADDATNLQIKYREVVHGGRPLVLRVTEADVSRIKAEVDTRFGYPLLAVAAVDAIMISRQNGNTPVEFKYGKHSLTVTGKHTEQDVTDSVPAEDRFLNTQRYIILKKTTGNTSDLK